jgi:carboxylesterase
VIDDHSFHFEGRNGRGMLLVHGLTGTPLEMRLLGSSLNKAGFTVRGVQLAGHCGTVDDLLTTRWQDWYESVQRAAEEVAREVDLLFIGGLSMGAMLALKYAADAPARVAGVGVYGVTFRYDGWAIPFTARLTFMLPLAKWLRICRHRMFMETEPYGLRDERLRAQISAAMHSGDSSVAGLPGNPWYSLYELFVLSRIVRRQLPQVIAPCFIAHAANDDIASVKNARLVEARVSGPTELLLLHDSYHMITIDRERRLLARRSAQFFAACAAPLAQRAAPARLRRPA